MTRSVTIAGCGYLGAEIARIHVERNHVVHSITRTGTEIEGVQSQEKDLSDPSIDLPDSEILYFTVSADSRTPTGYRDAYITALQNTLNSTSPETAIYTSSTGVYSEENAEWVDENTELIPRMERQRILVEAEQTALEHSAVVARLGGIYGPNRWGINRYLGDTEVLNGYTNRIRKKDAARAAVHLALKEPPGDIFNVVDDEPVHRHTLAKWLSQKTKKKPGALVDEKPSTNKRVKNEKIKSTGWTPMYPTYREGYRDYLATHS